MGIIFRCADGAEPRTDIHEGGDDGTDARQIVHVVQQYHDTSAHEHHENIDDEVADRKIDNGIIHGPLVQTDAHNRHGLNKYFSNGHMHVFEDDHVMDHLDTAGGGAGTGPDKTDRKKKHLGRLGPQFIVGGGKARSGQKGGDLKGSELYGFHEGGIGIFLPENP